ncbi:MAG: right-handed parallel beta-helix repeat-containing protein [Treponema sp.]|jgi:hypothetical protein|nr:right-handed parallel beta-helix repeat-containing protein [Treponema sp.]
MKMKNAGGMIAVIPLLAIVTACNLFNGNNIGYKEENDPNAFRAITLTENENMNRLSFGTSSGNASSNKITVNSDGSINLYSHKDGGSNAGKIAGSEDGITFYFKEVDANKNFKLSADAEVVFFGLQEGRTELNGQEGFGLMARDYVPQYPGFTLNALKGVTANGNYYAGSTGGTGNMIMAGGVKRGVRVYWRTGVVDSTTAGATEYSPDGEGDCIYDKDPNKIANADRAEFNFVPRELPDYSLYPTMSDRPDFPSAGKKYNLYLEKTNSGFRVVITPPADKGGDWNYHLNPYDPPSEKQTQIGVGQKLEYFIPEPDLLFSVNRNHYYVGFFASRSAEVKISNIRYEEADVEDCAPRIDLLPEQFTPSITIFSPATASTADYTFSARANVEGNISISLNGSSLPEELGRGVWTVEKSNASAKPFSLFTVPVTGLKTGDNTFRVIFYPGRRQNNSNYLLTSTTAIPVTFIVNRKSYGGGDSVIWVAPEGRRTGTGTSASPLDLDTAIAYVQPGQTIKMKDGIYSPLAVIIPRYNSGRPNPGAAGPADPDYYKYYKTLEAEHRDNVIIDFMGHPQNRAFELRGDYWKISGIHVRGTAPVKRKGLTVFGSHNRVEWVKTYNNGDTGLQISGESSEPKAFWPSHNTIAYCESFNNKDEAKEDADGFAAKLTVGEGNLFEWCVAHHNCDDGWDLFSKKETGAIGAVAIKNSIAYRNGYFFKDDGSGEAEYANSGGNGFKMGGEGISVKHEIENSLAFLNGADGFTSNSNPALVCTNCTAFDNHDRGFAIYGSGTSNPEGLDARMTRLLSLFSSGSHGNDGIWWNTTDTNPGYIWRDNKCQNRSNAVLTIAANIESTGIPWVDGAPFAPEIKGKFMERNAGGSFKLHNFLKTKNISGNQPGAEGLYAADGSAGN